MKNSTDIFVFITLHCKRHCSESVVLWSYLEQFAAYGSTYPTEQTRFHLNIRSRK